MKTFEITARFLWFWMKHKFNPLKPSDNFIDSENISSVVHATHQFIMSGLRITPIYTKKPALAKRVFLFQ